MRKLMLSLHIPSLIHFFNGFFHELRGVVHHWTPSPMALDEASVQIPDAFILVRCLVRSRPQGMPSHQIHLEQLKLGFFVENLREVSRIFLEKNR